MPIISGSGSGSAKISGVTITGVAAAGLVPVASSSSAGAWGLPAGAEIGYDQITASVNVTGLTEGTATTVITCAAHTFDGAPIMVQFQAVAISMDINASGDTTIVGLFEGGTLVNRFSLGAVGGVGANKMSVPGTGFMRITPTSGSHSYTVGAWVSATTGTPGVVAGVGGAGANPPAFCRFTKV